MSPGHKMGSHTYPSVEYDLQEIAHREGSRRVLETDGTQSTRAPQATNYGQGGHFKKVGLATQTAGQRIPQRHHGRSRDYSLGGLGDRPHAKRARSRLPATWPRCASVWIVSYRLAKIGQSPLRATDRKSAQDAAATVSAVLPARSCLSISAEAPLVMRSAPVLRPVGPLRSAGGVPTVRKRNKRPSPPVVVRRFGGPRI
jgi:hypothetical protein